MHFIKNKYGKDFIYNGADPPNNMSLMFKDIWSCSKLSALSPHLSINMFKWKVGDGKLSISGKIIGQMERPYACNLKDCIV